MVLYTNQNRDLNFNPGVMYCTVHVMYSSELILFFTVLQSTLVRVCYWHAYKKYSCEQY